MRRARGRRGLSARRIGADGRRTWCGEGAGGRAGWTRVSGPVAKSLGLHGEQLSTRLKVPEQGTTHLAMFSQSHPAAVWGEDGTLETAHKGQQGGTHCHPKPSGSLNEGGGRGREEQRDKSIQEGKSTGS